MALPPLALDDLAWDDLTSAARSRIAAASSGAWTLHAPVDPGVTLVELFSWLLDQRLYRMDRVPAPLFRAAIALLGERMIPVREASTLLALSRSPAGFVKAGSTLELARAEVAPLFSLREGLTLLPVERIDLFIGGADRSADLHETRGVEILPAGGSAAEAKLVLWMSAPIAGPQPRPFSLFLELAVAPAVRPEWDPDSVDVPPPAELGVWYSRTAGHAPRRFSSLHDGTGGMRRSGLLRLPVPPDWAPEGAAVNGLLPYALFFRTRAATFTAPVTLSRAVPNVAIARHRRIARRAAHVAAGEWLPLPGIEIELEDAERPPIPAELRLRIREKDGRWHRWKPVEDFARSAPADRVFVVDRARGRVLFGDGLNGRIPQPDPAIDPNLRLSIAVGGGAEGDVGGDLDWIADVAGGLTARGLVPAIGGREPETLDEARLRVGGLLEVIERAVTAADTERLAETTAGVAIARAHAAIGFHPGHPCTIAPGAVTVFVVPWAPRGEDLDAWRAPAPVPDPGALTAVRARLETARLVGTELYVCPPRYRDVKLLVRIAGDPDDPAAPRAAVVAALTRFLDPLVGGDDRNGWPFGDPLRPSVMMREALAALDDGEVVAVSIGLDGVEPSEDCAETAIGPHDLPALVSVQVRFETDRTARTGGLR